MAEFQVFIFQRIYQHWWNNTNIKTLNTFLAVGRGVRHQFRLV